MIPGYAHLPPRYRDEKRYFDEARLNDTISALLAR